jgi:hypothetical protein
LRPFAFGDVFHFCVLDQVEGQATVIWRESLGSDKRPGDC